MTNDIDHDERDREIVERIEARISEILNAVLRNDEKYVLDRGLIRWGRVESDLHAAVRFPFQGWTTNELFRELDRRGYLVPANADTSQQRNDNQPESDGDN
jgi:hypothetical protein